MTINYPLDIPNAPGQSAIQLIEVNRCAITHSPSTLQAQVYEYGGQGWGLRISIDPLTRAQAQPWMAFLSALYGRKGTFRYGDVLFASPLGLAGGSPRVMGANPVGTSLPTDGWVPNQIALRAGDMFQIDNSLYRCLFDAHANDSGEVAIDVWPMLRQHADNSVIITSSPKGIFRLTSNENDWQTTDDTKLYSIEFEAEEAL